MLPGEYQAAWNFRPRPPAAEQPRAGSHSKACLTVGKAATIPKKDAKLDYEDEHTRGHYAAK